MGDGAEVESGSGTHSFRRGMSVGLVLLIVLGLVLTGSAAYRLSTGVPDSYPSEQMRLFASGLGQVFLVGSLLAQHHGRKSLGWFLLAPAAGAIIWAVALM